MANVIITKFQNEGLDQLTQETKQAADNMDLMAKAQGIVAQSMDGLTKKQIELREAINSTGGIVKNMNETGRDSTTLYAELKTKLTGLVAEYESLSRVTKNSQKDNLDYNKVLQQVGEGHISARQGIKLLREEMVKLAVQGKTNTEQYAKLRTEAGHLTDAIGDVNAEAKQAGSDTRGIDKFIRTMNLGVQTATGLQAAYGLLGGKNKEFQENLLKLNELMLVSNSLQNIMEELTKKDSIAYTAAAAAQRLYAFAVGESTGALKLFRLALASTGIGLLIIGIITLISNFDSLTKSGGFLNNMLTGIGRIIKNTIQGYKDLSDAIGLTNFAAKEYAEAEKKRQADALDDLERAGKRKIALLKIQHLDTLKEELKQLQLEHDIQDKALRQAEDWSDEKRDKAIKSLKDIEDEITLKKAEIAQKKIEDDNTQDSFLERLFGVTGQKRKQLLEKVRLTIKDWQDALAKFGKDSVEERNAFIEKEGARFALSEYDKEQLKKRNDEVQKSLDKLNSLNEKYQKEDEARRKKNFKSHMDMLEAKLKADIRYANESNKIIVKALLEIEKANKENAKKHVQSKADENRSKEKLYEGDLKIQQQKLKDGLDFASNVGTGLFQLAKDVSDAKKGILDEELASGVISQTKYNQEVKKLKRQEAIAAKAEAVFRIGISIAEAIVKAMTAGPIIGQVLAGITAAIGAAQLAIVLAKPIPQFRKGVINLNNSDYPDGIDTVPSMLTKGESVMTVDETRRHHKALMAMRRNEFDQMFIPIDKIMRPDLPAALNIPAQKMAAISFASGQAGSFGGANIDMSGLQKKMDILIEEFGFASQYIKQGNSDRHRGTKQVINTLQKIRKDGY